MDNVGFFVRGIKLLLNLFMRVLFVISRITLQCLNRLYAWFFVIPYLTRRENISKPIIKFSLNTVVILEDRRVFKAALNTKSTIKLEINNFERICKEYPILLSILPDYKIKGNAFVSYLSTALYNGVDLSGSIILATRLFKIISECRKCQKRLQIIESAQLVAGLEIISQDYGDAASQRIHQIVDTFLENGKYHLGFAHGDFHSRNIVIDEHHMPRLIDLDCVRFCGIQELDAFYFLMEHEWSVSGNPWYETILRYFKGEISDEAIAILNKFGIGYDHGLAVTCLVDRIGQESLNYGFNYPHTKLAPAIEGIMSIQSGSVLPYSRVY